MSYFTLPTDDFLNMTNNETVFPELTRAFKEHIKVKLKEVSVPRYLNFLICQSPLGFSVDQTDHIMELVNEWFVTKTFRHFDTPFREKSAYEKELMAELPLPVHALHKQKWNIMVNLDTHLEGYNTFLL